MSYLNDKEQAKRNGIKFFNENIQKMNDPKQKYELARVLSIKKCNSKYKEASTSKEESCKKGVLNSYNRKMKK